MDVKRHVWFVRADGKLKRVCACTHPRGGRCSRHHGVPADALWSGVVDYDLRGELREAVREAKKARRNAYGRWLRRLAMLRKKYDRAPPAFKPYIDRIIATHAAQEPPLTLAIDQDRLVATAIVSLTGVAPMTAEIGQ